MSDEKPTKVYVSLDSLLDTRLGTLTVLSTDFAEEFAKSSDYYLRDEDRFISKKMGPLKKETFALLQVSQRDKIIRNSLKTPMIGFLKELMLSLFVQALTTPFHSSVAIDVNTYPYEFSDEEAAAMLAALAEKMAGHFTINLVYRKPEDLAIEYVHRHYRVLIMYQYHEWMNLHDIDLKKSPMREVTLFVPHIYVGYVPSDADLLVFQQNNCTPFSLLEDTLKPFIGLQHLPIALYSADTPFNLKEYVKK